MASKASGRRFLLIAVLLSVGVHLLAAGFIVFLPRIALPKAALQKGGTVELLMVEQKGAVPRDAGLVQPLPQKPDAPIQAKPAPAPKTASEPEISKPGDKPAPPPIQSPRQTTAKVTAQPTPKQAKAPPPPSTPKGPVFDLAGTDSEVNAVTMGANVLPAIPDDKYRNRGPIYPIEAQIRGEHGSVTVVVHVSEDGVPTGADIAQSSGVDVLDQAALAAVRKWRFRPAMKDGQAVRFDFPFEFIFEPK